MRLTPRKVVGYLRDRGTYRGQRREHVARARGQVVPDGPALFVYGHSFAAGFEGDGGSPMWPRLLADQLGLPLVNRAVGGDSSRDTRARAKLVKGRPDRRDLVLVEIGLNDVVRFGHRPTVRQTFALRLRTIVTRLGAAGARVVVVTDPPLPDWSALPRGHRSGSDACSDALRQVCLSYPDAIDTWPGWDPPTMICPDHVHPNAEGTRSIAASVLAALRS